jgi:hypothetical protein
LQPIHSRSPYDEAMNLREPTTTTNTFEDPQPRTNLRASEASAHNRVFNLGIDGPLPLNTDQDMYSDSLPFDNLNVQELWTWMGDLDGFDNYSYQGSYEGNGT